MIKNTKLGGTDWGEEYLYYNDLNDTFNAAADYITGLTTFWLNSDLYNVYDDFESYSTGAFTTNTDWTVSTTQGGGSSDVDIVSSTVSGGTGKELRLNLGANNLGETPVATVLTKNLVNNKNVWCRCAGKAPEGDHDTHDSNAYIKIKWGTSETTTADIYGLVDSINFSVFVVALGSDLYDVYFGGKKVLSSITQTGSPQLQIKMTIDMGHDDSVVNAYLYIDDVRQSKSSL